MRTLKKSMLTAALTVSLAAFAGLSQAAPAPADPFTDGARTDARNPYSDGARADARDTFTDGARADARDARTDGA
ncbi:hypothetical protein [Paracidovorax citrulli]